MQRLLSILAAIWLVSAGSAALAQSDWKDYVEDPGTRDESVEDNPEWEKYDFELSLAGSDETMSFREIARKGEPFVIVWWLTNCPMCHLQMPFVQKLFRNTQEAGVEFGVYGICIDSHREEGLKYIDEHSIAFDILIDERARRTREFYRVDELGTPLAYIFNEKGILVDKIEGYRNNFGSAVLKMLEIELPGADK